ncbi:MAG: hypothetical protein GX589_02005 [Deltaproteobacteria bacterium]|nr:hypothetical protein [Deltaproteobacteria bacterium]
MKKIAILTAFVLANLVWSGPALAGDGATIILKSGAVIYINNGYQQVVDGLSKFNTKGDYNHHLLVNIADAPFYINLGTVALICRDRCRSLEITVPKKEKSGR